MVLSFLQTLKQRSNLIYQNNFPFVSISHSFQNVAILNSTSNGVKQFLMEAYILFVINENTSTYRQYRTSTFGLDRQALSR